MQSPRLNLFVFIAVVFLLVSCTTWFMSSKVDNEGNLHEICLAVKISNNDEIDDLDLDNNVCSDKNN